MNSINAVDFDDLIAMSLWLLQDNETVRQRWQNKVGYLLIDEYDKPIIDFFTEIEKAKINLGVLRALFSTLKGLDKDGDLRFLFITGVSKFSKVSLFSDLNNLTDLSIDPLSSDLLGITHKELLFYFDSYIQKAADKFKMSKEEILKGIKLWYNGYSFDGESRLYNPYSILNFFGKLHFGNFWFATGTPTFLVKSIIVHKPINKRTLRGGKVIFKPFIW